MAPAVSFFCSLPLALQPNARAHVMITRRRVTWKNADSRDSSMPLNEFVEKTTTFDATWRAPWLTSDEYKLSHGVSIDN